MEGVRQQPGRRSVTVGTTPQRQPGEPIRYVARRAVKSELAMKESRGTGPAPGRPTDSQLTADTSTRRPVPQPRRLSGTRIRTSCRAASTEPEAALITVPAG